MNALAFCYQGTFDMYHSMYIIFKYPYIIGYKLYKTIYL